jgi:serine protein kinase
MVMNELEKGSHHSLISGDDQRKKYRDHRVVASAESSRTRCRNNQRRHEEAIMKLAANYIDNIRPTRSRRRVEISTPGSTKSRTSASCAPSKKRSHPENRKDDFRREIMNFTERRPSRAKSSTGNRTIAWRALELKLFEDQKDSIKLKTLVSAVVDKETQEKIDIIKSRLIRYLATTK